MAKVLIIAGPTGSGKSAFAKNLARAKKGIILNADSLQVYKGLEVLTAQPSFEDQQEIPHRLYGFLKPSEICSAGRWLSFILPEIQETLAQGRLPIVVGGTGLYLKSLMEGMATLPPIDPHIREELIERVSSQEVYYAELQRVDPDLAQRVNPQDKQRTLRGLEVFYGTGKSLSYWQAQKPKPLPYDFKKIFINIPQEELRFRIAHRLDNMLIRDVLKEVSNVLPLSPSSNVMKAIGFREFESFLKNQSTLEEAKRLTLIHTYQYAKRQMTWFRHQFKPDCMVEDLSENFA